MKLDKKDRKMIVMNSEAVKKDSEKAIIIFKKGLHQAKVDLATAEALIKKFK